MCDWSPEPAKLNCTFSRVARRSLPSAPASCTFSQDTLRPWERAFQEQSVTCNQAAGLSRCLTKVQDAMVTHLKTLRVDKSKGKAAEKMQQAVEELEYLVTFNRSICQAMQRTMQDLSEGVFISMANLTLTQRDSYLEFLRGGVKPDTLTALRTAPVHLHSLFPDNLLVKAEDEISRSEERHSSGSSHRKPGRFHLYVSSSGRSTQQPDRKPTTPAWKQIRDRQIGQKGRGKASNFTQKPAKGSKKSKLQLLCFKCSRSEGPCTCIWQEERFEPFTSDQQEQDCIFTCKLLCCKCSFCHRVATKERRKSQLLLQSYRNKACERCFLCRSLELGANIVTNVPAVVVNPPVGARLHQFWEKWEALGSSPKVVTILREGYTLPFWFRPNLTRSPTVISNYVNPQRQSHLLEALYQLTNKNAVEPVTNQNSLGFYNRLFLVPKPNNRWRPIPDLSTLNTFLNTELFKMETPETIRTSLQLGEWVTSIDFKDAYFHIPIHSQSRKYMHFHIQGQSYQFKALPFGLSTAPMEFTVVAKEVKLMALQRGIRIHQHLDDWLVRATSHQIVSSIHRPW